MNEQPTINTLTNNNANKNKPSGFHIFLFVFLFMVFYIVMSTLIYAILMAIASITNQPFEDYLIALIVIPSALLFGLPPFLYCSIKHVSPVDALKLHKLSGKNIMYAILVGILLMPISSALSLVLQFVFPNPIQDTLDQTLSFNFGIVFLALAISPAIFEELMFRGLFFYKFRYLKPIHIALISSFAFGLVHMNMVQGVYATVMGFCFFYLVYYTNSIFSSMISHLVINGTNVTIFYMSSLMLAKEPIEETSATVPMEVTVFYVVLACVCSFLVYKLFQKIKSSNKGNFIDLSTTQITD